ncbi:MAG: nucleotidyltransferase/DNA polymerase involved in repair [Eubacterium sp.]|nr:nucleotidyltransferase/DNA polymerase involved in repair [Eubacterium sp.]
MEKVILHSDLNNFYASVECLYQPELKNKPVAVGGSVEHRHGIILAKNTIAKGFGIKTGEAIWQAKQKCPTLTVLPPNYDRYIKFSKLAREIYHDYTDKIEAFGIDENWLDVTDSTRLFGDGEKIAEEIRRRMLDETGITVSVGVSWNKIFAKLGSDLKKPDQVSVIAPNDLWPLPAKELLYVGPSTWRKLSKIGLYTIGDIATVSPNVLTGLLGKWGEYLWIFANGLDTTPVSLIGTESIIKGIGNSMTTPRDLETNEDVKTLFYVLAESVAERLRNHYFKGRTIQIHVRDKELVTIDRQAPLSTHSFVSSEIAEKAFDIFLKNWTWDKPIRSIGIRATDLISADAYTQLSLFEDDNKRFKKELLESCIDDLRRRYGHYSTQRALMLKDKKLNANPIEENIIFPVSYFK